MPSSSQLAVRPTRSDEIIRLGLSNAVEAWRRRQRGPEYVDGLRTFLKSVSPTSRKVYTRTIAGFFEWHEIVHAQIPLPSDVTRERAFEYAQFLQRDDLAYTMKRIERDKPPLYAAIYGFVRDHPGAHIDTIRAHLLSLRDDTVLVTRHESGVAKQIRVLLVETEEPDGLDRVLACMASACLLHRLPSMRDIRVGRVQLGLENPRQAGIKYRVDPSVFSYSIWGKDRNAGARASSARSYLRTLSSFWTWLIENAGENVRMSEPLLRYNVWTMPARQLVKQVEAHQQVTRAETIMTMDLFNRLIGTTYKTLTNGHPVASTALVDARDRALMLFLLYVAPRKEEMARLRRKDIVWSPTDPYVRITGKGRKERIVRIPTVAYDALLDLNSALERIAIQQERRSPGVVSSARRVLEQDGPVFPSMPRWGCAAEVDRDNMGDSAIAGMLHSRAERIGIGTDHPDFHRIHPHGFRHLAAHLAVMAGTPVPIIQAVLGHADLSTTGIYTESHDPRDHILFGWQPAGMAAGRHAPGERATGPVVSPVPSPEPTEAPHRPASSGPEVIQTVGQQVPEPPPVPARERLVQIGEVAPPAPGAHVVPRDDAVGQLESVYADRWGERGTRQAFGTGPLAQVYTGTATGLPWWAGPTGALKPELPVMGPVQVAGFGGPFGSVREGLERLWHRWVGGQDRGPTSAAALIAWIRDALEIATVTDDELQKRGGRWVAHDWPLRLSALHAGETRKSFRLHREDRIVDWFSQNGWQHRISRGRAGAAGERVSRVIDTRPDLPSWYALSDPLSELAPAERTDLADWLLALTGRPPSDRTPRYQGASRRDLAEIIGLLCEYDDRVDELKELGRSSKDRDTIAEAKQDVAALAEAVRLRVTLATKQRVASFNIEPLAKARSAETRQAVAKEGGPAPESVMEERTDAAERGRERRRDFYMRIVGDLFGKEAANDEFLRIFALCSRGTPLGEGFYPQLFNFEKGVIVHRPEFAKRFAKETGAHSECVARRMARELWELRRLHLTSLVAGGRGERAISRPDELVETLDAMAAYRIPCPEALEKELQQRLGTTNRQPVYEEWERYKKEVLPATREEERAREREEAVAETMAEAQERHRQDIGLEFARAKETEYTKNARRYVPSPVLLVFALYTR